jgi:hypothetical protein
MTTANIEEYADEHDEGSSNEEYTDERDEGSNNEEYADEYDDEFNNEFIDEQDERSSNGVEQDEDGNDEYLHRDNTTKRLHSETDITLLQAVLIIKCFSLRHSLSKVALQDLLQLIGMLLPRGSLLPSSLYMFNKLFPDSSTCVSRYYCCQNHDCLSIVESPDEQHSCNKCGESFSKQIAEAKGYCFLILDIAFQIRNILQKFGNQVRSTIPDNEIIATAMDGDYYNSIGELRPILGNISLIWNCDGVPLFRNSTNSLWPIRLKINELPEKLSSRSIIVGALWFGPVKPKMHSYLNPFITAVNSINTAGGIKWKHPMTQMEMQSKAFLIYCCADSPARCMLQGMQQFNGEFGCSWCEHKGEICKKGRGHVRVFPLEACAVKRTHASIIQHATESINLPNVKHVMGVKTLSPVVLLSHFDMTRSFTVDSMHAVFLGVVKLYLDLWLNTKFHGSNWYISNKVKEIDKKLLALRPPSDVKRLPRTVSKYTTWKAAECRNWLLFYSLFALADILPQKYLCHWKLLVNAVFYLLSSSIRKSMLTGIHAKLCDFASQMSALYGKEHITYNVHLLTHLCGTVRDAGPLFCTSAFAFESHNQKMLKLFNGTTHILDQISDSIVKLSTIPGLQEKCKDQVNSTCIENFVNNLLYSYPMVLRSLRQNGVILLGSPHRRALSDNERTVLQAIQYRYEYGDFYSRAIIEGTSFATDNYCRKLKTIMSVLKFQHWWQRRD